MSDRSQAVYEKMKRSSHNLTFFRGGSYGYIRGIKGDY